MSETLEQVRTRLNGEAGEIEDNVRELDGWAERIMGKIIGI